MFGWTRREPEPAAAASPPPAGVVHDIVQVQVLGLLVTDTFRWKRDWATWRVRFGYSNDSAGHGFRQVSSFVREAAAQLCQHRCDCAEIVLYMSHLDDVKAAFATYGMVPAGIGQISAIQHRDTYLQAAALAAELATIVRAPDRAVEDDAMSLPDLTWSIDGQGMSRVASTELRGRRIVVRLGIISGTELWLVGVNDRPACARFRSRLDAMSKMGVAAALRAYEARRK